MADVAISSLPAAGALTGTEIVPLVQGGVTSRSTTSAVSALGGGGTTSKVTGSDFTNSTNTLTNITGLTYAASANTKYEVDSVLIFQTTNTAGLQFALQFSAAGAAGSYLLFGNSGSSGIATAAAAALGTGLGTFGTATGTYMTLYLKGTVIVGANTGNITVQMLRLTGGTGTVYIGSRMTVTQL